MGCAYGDVDFQKVSMSISNYPYISRKSVSGVEPGTCGFTSKVLH